MRIEWFWARRLGLQEDASPREGVAKIRVGWKVRGTPGSPSFRRR